jgi:hypothetical protein
MLDAIVAVTRNLAFDAPSFKPVDSDSDDDSDDDGDDEHRKEIEEASKRFDKLKNFFEFVVDSMQ